MVMKNSLILREEDTYIEKNVSIYATYQTLYSGDISDLSLSNFVSEIVNFTEYQNLFLPLCFGPIMSDFNGLRLAAHVRCTPGQNQLKNIYIYSFADIEDLITHEFFNILKSKGVYLVKYNYYIIKELLNNTEIRLQQEDLKFEIKKLNLPIPANYEDSHSVVNEWEIYRWAKAINCEDIAIRDNTDIQSHNIYFKYLRTILPVGQLNHLHEISLGIGNNKNKKVL